MTAVAIPPQPAPAQERRDGAESGKMWALRPDTQDSPLMRLCPTCGARYEAPAQFCQRDGVPLRIEQEARDPYLGTRILGQFRLEKVIGSGGMGVVYAGWDEALGRRVAVKILHKDLVSNRDVVQRFHREAQIAHHLDHPNIVRLILFGQLPDGNLYLVLEYLEGPTLAGALEHDGPFAPARAVKIISAIADAIGYAHRRDIVHRDLKPENVILVHRDGDADHPKVLDFGIAKMLMSGDTLVTQAGLIFGTARYISPEGAQGDPVDKRSDVYSLGVMAYQLLAGQAPFDAAEPVQLLLKHIHEAPPPLRVHKATQDLPPALEAVVMRALAKSPAARYGDGSAFARALREALAQSDPSSAIRSVVPTAAMPMFASAPGAVAPVLPAPRAESDSGVRPHPAPPAPQHTLVNGSLGPQPSAAPASGPYAPEPAPATAASSGPYPVSSPYPAAAPAVTVAARPHAAERVAMPAVQPYAPPAVYAAPDVETGQFPPASPARPYEPPARAPAHAIHVDSDDDIVVPGLSPRRRGASGSRTALTVVASVLLTLVIGAGAGWALGMYPSQRREAEIRDLFARAEEAFRADRLAHDNSGNDVEDLTDALLVLAPGNARARQLRAAAAMRLRNAAVQQMNEGHPDRALPLLRGAVRLADNDTELRELIARAERDAQPPAPAPATPPATEPPTHRPPPRATPSRPRAGVTPAGVVNDTEPAAPIPVIPTGRPTFTPGRDPAVPVPPPEQPPPSNPPPVIIQQPPSTPPEPAGGMTGGPSVPDNPPPSDPNAGGVAF